MKKTLLTLVAFGLLSVSLFAGNGPLSNDFSMRRPELKKRNMLLGAPVSRKADDSFGEGKFIVSAGYGFPNLWKAVLTAAVNDSATDLKVIGMGPIHFRAEYALSDGVGFGVSVNYVSAGVSYTDLPYTYKFTRSSLSVLARLNFHFGTSEKLDPYFGVGAGYKQASFKFESNDPSYDGETFPGFNPFGFETTVGMRYYITPGFGIYTELGIAKSVIQAGIAASF